MLCPHCKNPVKKVKDNICPICECTVVKYKGVLYKENPVDTVLGVFVDMMTAKLSRDKPFPVPFKLPVKSHRYRTERKAARQLLNEAGDDLDLLLEAMLWLNGTKAYGWRINSSLRNFMPLITVGLSVITAKREAEAERISRGEAFDAYYEDLQEQLD